MTTDHLPFISCWGCLDKREKPQSPTSDMACAPTTPTPQSSKSSLFNAGRRWTHWHYRRMKSGNQKQAAERESNEGRRQEGDTTRKNWMGTTRKQRTVKPSRTRYSKQRGRKQRQQSARENQKKKEESRYQRRWPANDSIQQEKKKKVEDKKKRSMAERKERTRDHSAILSCGWFNPTGSSPCSFTVSLMHCHSSTASIVLTLTPLSVIILQVGRPAPRLLDLRCRPSRSITTWYFCTATIG